MMRGRLLRVLPLGVALICVGAALLAVGCGSSTDSRFRYVQAATVPPGNVDVEVDSKTVLTSIGFGQTPTYQKVSSGSHTVGIFLSGTTTNPAFSGTVSFASGDTTLLSINPFSSIALAAYTDDNTAPASGDFKLRIIHASPTSGNVDLYIVTPPGSISGLSPQKQNLAFSPTGSGNATSYFSFAAGNYEVVMTQAGTQNPIPLLDATYTFTAGQIRTILILDNSSGGGAWSQLELSDLN
jgi:hypothetical protein